MKATAAVPALDELPHRELLIALCPACGIERDEPV